MPLKDQEIEYNTTMLLNLDKKDYSLLVTKRVNEKRFQVPSFTSFLKVRKLPLTLFLLHSFDRRAMETSVSLGS